MRARTLAVLAVAAAGLGSSTALASHFDNTAATGSFNPLMTLTATQSSSPLLVNRPTTVALRITQQDHEDPIVIGRLRWPGDWQFDYASTRQAENELGVPTTSCRAAVDNDRNSPAGTGQPGGNTDFSKRSDAFIARAEKIGRVHLEAHAETISRPGPPIVWDGDLAFISYDAVNDIGKLCALFITTHEGATAYPDPPPPAGSTRDDVEDVTELLAEFSFLPVVDGSDTWLELLVDLTDLVQAEALQALQASLIELRTSITGHSVGNWDSGGIDFSLAPSISGNKRFQGTFKTCPTDDSAYLACKSGRPDVVRNFAFPVTLPAPVLTSPVQDAILNTNPVPVSGTADPFASVQVYEGTTAVGSPATADGGGIWNASVPLADGTRTIVARTIDSGTLSPGPVSNSRTFKLDTVAPLAPAINLPNEGSLIAGTSVTISGTAEAGTSVEIVESTGTAAPPGVFAAPLTLGTVTAGQNGSWTLTVTMSKGPHQVQARATDAATNAGPFSGVRSFDVTTAIPIISAPQQNFFSNVTTIDISGFSEPGATVTIHEGGSMVGSPVVATGAGTWTLNVSFPEGEHMITATALAGGFTSPPSAIRTLTIDLTPPPAPVFAFPVAGQTVRSIGVPVSGDAEAFASVAVYEGPRRIGTTIAGADGRFALTILMADGSHTIRAQATDRAGNVGPFSANLSFVVEDPLAILEPVEGSFNAGTVQITGTADAASSQVRVFEDLIEIARVPVDPGDGSWSVARSFPSGNHTITARAVTDGVLGPPTDPRRFKIDADAPDSEVKLPSGYLLFGRLFFEPMRGYASDDRASDSRLDRIVVVYTNLFTGEETTHTIGVPPASASKIKWSDDPGVAPGFYEVTATVYDRVGNSASDGALFLIL